MIVQCPGCKDLVKLESFSAHNDVLAFQCPSCKAKQRIGSERTGTNHASTALPSTPPVAAEPTRVPAGLTGAAAASAMTSTLLGMPAPAPLTSTLLERPDAKLPTPGATPASDLPVPSAIPPPAPAEVKAGPDAHLWKAWNKVVADWSKPTAHDAFIGLCAGAGSLPFAGLRYRDRLGDRPDDDMAKRGRDRVLAQAMVIATSAKEVAGPPGYFQDPRNRKVLTIGVGAVAMVIVWALIKSASRLPSTNPNADEGM